MSEPMIALRSLAIPRVLSVLIRSLLTRSFVTRSLVTRSLVVRTGVLFCLAMLSSCVVTPTKVAYHDKECGIERNTYKLSLHYLGENPTLLLKKGGSGNPHHSPRPRVHCSGSECIEKIVLPVVTSAVTIPVSLAVSLPIAIVRSGMNKAEEDKHCALVQLERQQDQVPSQGGDIIIDVKPPSI